MIALRTLQERVRKSALLLDKEVKGWAKKITIQHLDMVNPDLCLVGQLNQAGVKNSLNKFDYNRAFNINSHEGIDYQPLTRLWIYQIKKRLKA